jgi:hypothetical protein
MSAIGLVDVDGHHFPNLALMKISAYHKKLGDSVEWADPMFGHYDRVYQSKVFTFTQDYPYEFDCEVLKGGTGYDITSKLPKEIDDMQPDYSIYPTLVDARTAYGFLTRGCPNKCKWCIVPKKEGGVHPYRDIEEIAVDGRDRIILMDNNILASDYGLEQLEKVVRLGLHIDANQAVDARRVTDDVAKLLAKVKWINGTIRFGCDTPAQIAECERAMKMIDGYRGKPAQYLLYTMISSDLNEAYERLSYWRSFPKCRVVCQPFRDFNNPNQVIPQWQHDMARWGFRREFYTMFDFKDFSPRKGFVCREYFKDKDKDNE